ASGMRCRAAASACSTRMRSISTIACLRGPRLSCSPRSRAQHNSCPRSRLAHDRDACRRTRDARIQPAAGVLAKGKALVEEVDVVPLRALRLVDRQDVAESELVRAAALGIGKRFGRAVEEGRIDRHDRPPLARLALLLRKRIAEKTL